MPQTAALLDTGIPKVIDPAIHGVADYCHAAFFITVGVLSVRSNKRGAFAAFATGGFILAQSLLKDYKYGIKPVFSFKTHGKMDVVMAASSWTIPLMFGFRGTGVAKIFEGNSMLESALVAATDWDSQLAHEERLAS